MNPEELAKQAASARELAYAPYSKFKVGAAILDSNGNVYTGCNVENASYGMSMCAERVALYKAISEGRKSIQSIAISLSGAGSPCGACRQALHEFNPSMRVHLADESGSIFHETTLNKLLPHAFGPENLD
ncbi:MAG: cytidine deaminase [Akkermansiaceae bacterium]